MCIHIGHLYNPDRFKFINRFIDEINKYECDTDLFIHTTKEIPEEVFHKNKKGKIEVCVYTKFPSHPIGSARYASTTWYLPWLYRPMLEKQIDDYDIFMGIEDDVLFYKETLEYWLKYKDDLIERNINLGFLLVEKDDKGEKFWVNSPGVRLGGRRRTGSRVLPTFLKIKDNLYIINNIEPYCTFWIYDRNEMKRWMREEYWDPNKIKRWIGRCQVAEPAMLGMSVDGYKYTAIPLIKRNGGWIKKVDPNCTAWHQSQRMIKFDNSFSTVKVNECIVSTKSVIIKLA